MSTLEILAELKKINPDFELPKFIEEKTIEPAILQSTLTQLKKFIDDFLTEASAHGVMSYSYRFVEITDPRVEEIIARLFITGTGKHSKFGQNYYFPTALKATEADLPIYLIYNSNGYWMFDTHDMLESYAVEELVMVKLSEMFP